MWSEISTTSNPGASIRVVPGVLPDAAGPVRSLASWTMVAIRRPALLALPLLLLAGCGLGPGTTTTEDVPLTGDVRTVVLDVGSGDVSVRHDPSVSAPRLERRLQYWGTAPGTTTDQAGDRLALDGCPGRCSVDYELVLPTAGAAVSGSLSSGGVELAGVGDVDVDLSSGDVRLSDVTGPVAVAVASGDVLGDGLGGDTTVASSSGSVRLTLARPASVEVRASSGDVTVAVPAGDYAVRAGTSSGETRSSVPSTPGAAHTLDLATDSGDVVVEAA